MASFFSYFLIAWRKNPWRRLLLKYLEVKCRCCCRQQMLHQEVCYGCMWCVCTFVLGADEYGDSSATTAGNLSVLFGVCHSLDQKYNSHSHCVSHHPLPATKQLQQICYPSPQLFGWQEQLNAKINPPPRWLSEPCLPASVWPGRSCSSSK